MADLSGISTVVPGRCPGLPWVAPLGRGFLAPTARLMPAQGNALGIV